MQREERTTLSWDLADSGFVLVSILDLFGDFEYVVAFFPFLSGSRTTCHFVSKQWLE